jgi:hypothetical protein
MFGKGWQRGLLVTERGLLGFCIDDLIQEDDNTESSSALFIKFEKTLKENFAASKGKGKIMKEEKVDVDTKEIINSGNVEIQSTIGEKLGQVSDGGLNDGDKLVNPSAVVCSEIQVNSKVDVVHKS